MRTLNCRVSPPLDNNDWPVRRGYEAVITYLPCGMDVVFQPNEKIKVDPTGTLFETEDTIVYDVRFTAVTVN